MTIILLIFVFESFLSFFSFFAIIFLFFIEFIVKFFIELIIISLLFISLFLDILLFESNTDKDKWRVHKIIDYYISRNRTVNLPNGQTELRKTDLNEFILTDLWLKVLYLQNKYFEENIRGSILFFGVLFRDFFIQIKSNITRPNAYYCNFRDSNVGGIEDLLCKFLDLSPDFYKNIDASKYMLKEV